MENFVKLHAWLQEYPDISKTGILLTDFTDALPGSTGLFPLGLQELRQKKNIAGGIKAENQEQYTLLRVTCGQQDNEENARWLLQFQNWIQQQSAMNLAPVFGENQQIRAEKGRLYRSNQAGTGIYTVIVTVSYTKKLR